MLSKSGLQQFNPPSTSSTLATLFSFNFISFSNSSKEVFLTPFSIFLFLNTLFNSSLLTTSLTLTMEGELPSCILNLTFFFRLSSSLLGVFIFITLLMSSFSSCFDDIWFFLMQFPMLVIKLLFNRTNISV
ncbi:unnamed protein product [Vicia faba]|uniref:Uncharacterized protein n=1 Tax=Vicia faba TaxID=3906 RepID=A0AAV0Z2P3_VICFA|nr:unnamed protein product [Vicia faba]